MTRIKTIIAYVWFTITILTSCASEPAPIKNVSSLLPYEMGIEEKLYFCNLYYQYKNDSTLQSPTVKENKDEFLRIIKEAFEANDSFDNYDSTNKSEESYVQIAHMFVHRLKDIYEDKNIVLAALSASFDESISDEMEQYYNNIKPIYVEELLKSCELDRDVPPFEIEYYSPKFDSISYALGYTDGSNLRASLSYHLDEYEFIEGLRIGHRIALGANINPDSCSICDQVLQNINSRPVSFTIGLTTGIEGAQKLSEITYIAGAFYGGTGKRPQWAPKEIRAYLTKNPKIERGVSTFEIQWPNDVKEAIEKKLATLH